MIETLILALLFAKIKGYKLKPIFMIWEAYPQLLFTLMYIILEICLFHGNYHFVRYAAIFKPLYLCTFLFLIIKYVLNKQAIIGSSFLVFGSILNQLVMNANNNKMPVFPKLSITTGYVNTLIIDNVDKLHVFGTSSTKLKFLADIFDFGYCIMSIGDVLIRAFVFIILYYSIKEANKEKMLKRL
jgi:hypothetical protein